MNKKYFFTYFSLLGGKNIFWECSQILHFSPNFLILPFFPSILGHIFSTFGYFKNYTFGQFLSLINELHMHILKCYVRGTCSRN